MKVSIQGISGAFHEEAVKKYFGNKAEVFPNLTFELLVDSVETNKVPYGMMAIDNSISGTIVSNLDILSKSDLQIVGEVYLPIKQNLIGMPNAKINELKEVYSHYMAIDQCKPFFSNYSNIHLIKTEDTALSIKMISDNKLIHQGAIGSRLAAKKYGLSILKEDIHSDKNNITRFVVIESKGKFFSNNNNDKATWAFCLKSEQSIKLIIDYLQKYSLFITKVYENLMSKTCNQYYVDVFYKDKAMYIKCLENLRMKVLNFVVLGNYKTANNFVRLKNI